jgi:urease accessory protein
VGGLATGLRAAFAARFTAEGGRQRAEVSGSPALELCGPFGSHPMPFHYLRNTTCGIFAGDNYDVTITAEAGAQVQIASSSATKVHAMQSDAASVTTLLRARAGSLLVWGPHPLLVQAGARLRQVTRLEIEDETAVILAEVLVLGRLARGERACFDSLDYSLAIRRDGKPLFDERYSLTPGLELSRSLGGWGVLVSVYGAGLGQPELAGETELDQDARFWGHSALPNGAGVVVRCLCDSLSEGMAFAGDWVTRLIKVAVD